MDILETYILLFTDTLVSNFAFNISTELAIHSMKIFGLYNSYLIILTASLAFMFAGCINYLLGILCYKILSPLSSREVAGGNINTEKMRRSKYLPLFLMLGGVPFFGKFITLFAGFCKVNPALTITVCTSARFTYYSMLMLM